MARTGIRALFWSPFRSAPRSPTVVSAVTGRSPHPHRPPSFRALPSPPTELPRLPMEPRGCARAGQRQSPRLGGEGTGEVSPLPRAGRAAAKPPRFPIRGASPQVPPRHCQTQRPLQVTLSPREEQENSQRQRVRFCLCSSPLRPSPTRSPLPYTHLLVWHKRHRQALSGSAGKRGSEGAAFQIKSDDLKKARTSFSPATERRCNI